MSENLFDLVTTYSCSKSSLDHCKRKCLERKDKMQLKSGVAESSWSGSMGSVAVSVHDKILELEKIEKAKVAGDEKRLAIEDAIVKEIPLRMARWVGCEMAQLVMFGCVCCKERFPTFHPGYQPSEEFGMELFSLCSSAVASWEASAPRDAGVHGVTDGCCGTWLRRQKDIVDQRSRRCFRNCMDPCWNFPREEYAALFVSLTFTEAVLVALDWMQVNVCSCRSICQHKFMGNAICFAEERANFFEAMGAMRQYRARDETCPGSFFQDVADDEKPLFSRVTDGYMAFVVAVQCLENGGRLVLLYDHGVGEGIVKRDNLSPRLLMMPRHASALHGNLVILLRKNLGFGQGFERIPLESICVARH